MTEQNEVDPDGDVIVAYAAGELTERAQVAFEVRLATEPALADRFQEYLELDLVGEALRAEAPPVRRLSPVWTVGLAAAAGLALIWLLWFGGDDRVEFTVTPVATRGADSLVDYATSLGVKDADLVPGETRRGANDTRPQPTVAAYLQKVAAAESARDAELFARPTPHVTAEFLTLRFRPQADCSAVVVELDSTGQLRRRFPGKNGLFGEAENRFAKGQIHVLPRPVAVAAGAQRDRISTYPGFDVPSDLRVQRTWLLLGLRAERVDAELLAALDAALAEASTNVEDLGDEQAGTALAPVVAWLEAQGFALRRVVATGPQ